MASKEEGAFNQELNGIFKSMGERGKEGEIWKKYTELCFNDLLQKLSEFCSKTFDNCMILRAYGSAVEDLKCLASDDIGDLDIVICPKSDDLMIHDEMIEDSANPMHVKIKGIGHPFLSFCVLEGTEYVATSALKNFHAAIYGKSAPHMITLLIRAVDIASKENVFSVAMQWKNEDTSPALQIGYKQSFGPISGELERIKNPQALTNVNLTQWEWLVHGICQLGGVKYSEEHADVLKEYLEFANEIQTSFFDKGELSKPQAVPLLFLQELFSSDRFRNMRERIQDIESRKHNESRRQEDCMANVTERKNQQDVTPGNESGRSDDETGSGRDENKNGSGPSEDEIGSRTSEHEVSQENFPSKNGSRVKVKNVDDNQIPSSLSQANMASTSEVPKLSSRNQMSRSDLNVKENRDPQRESQTDSSKEQQPSVVTPPTEAVLQPSPKDEYEDFKTLLTQTDRFFEYLFKNVTEEAEAAPTESPVSTKAAIAGGFDLVPALRSPGWPKVALDWIKRERKWPSPDIVHTIVQEGFHLVVKPPKKGGNPECDFRISFSNAEYLLSQEMNDIQRDCYRCLKKYHRAYLKEPKGLVTFHLKNVLLKTIEETGSDMWTESNRSDCVMKLLGSLLEALVSRDLRHFFVGSYNLFGIDYIENPEILDSLAEKTIEILENPVHFAKLIEDEEAAKQVQTAKVLSRSDPAENTAPGQRDGEADQTSASGNDEGKKLPEVQTVSTKVATTPHARGSSTGYRFHDLKDVYLATGQDLIDKAFKEDFFLNGSDSIERCLVEDLREMIAKHNLNAEGCLKVFECFWDIVYWKVWMNPEPNLRRRMLSAFQGVIASMKYLLRQDDLVMGNEEAIAARMLDPDAEDPLDLSNLYPAGIGTQVLHRFLSNMERGPDPPRQESTDDIPLD